MNLSLSLILTVIFAGFILHSIWSLVNVFRTPQCIDNKDTCYNYYLNSNPDLDLIVFISGNTQSGKINLVLDLKKFNYTTPFEKQIPLDLEGIYRNNGSLIIHIIIIPTKTRRNELIINKLANKPDSIYLTYKITKYAIPASAAFNLLKDTQVRKNPKPVSHLISKFSIIMCTEHFRISYKDIPMEFMNTFRKSHTKSEFLPIVGQDVLQMRTKDLLELTPELKTVPFLFGFHPVSVGKMRFFMQIQATLHNFINLGFTEKDLDEVKGVFADTNLYLLCATITIGSIHLLLDFLSFKNDVSFWKSQTSMAGLSSKTLLWRAFSQFVVFLYLLDEGTSLLVLIPSGIATLIEFWKVCKIFKFSWTGMKFASVSAEEAKTKEYDDECMRYLSYLLYPLCICYAIYSLFYQPHKSWYSWTINSLVNGVYAFGFLFMLPQLFINYRLKSVAALPWRAFTYRAFNTFIDDIFAFIITMPTAHRVACFRDDIVFLIYLYQRWLYPEDKTRTDELVPNKEDSKKTK